MDAEHVPFANSQVRVRDRLQVRCLHVKHRQNFVAVLASAAAPTSVPLHDSALVEALIVRKNVGSCVAHHVVDVLPIDSLVQNIHKLAWSVLNLRNRLDKFLILADAFLVPAPNKKR